MIALEPTEYRMLRMCFSPASAAILGASTDPSKFGGRALKFCLERGYGGRLYPINPRADIVQGVQAWPDLASLPEAPEIVVIAVPAAGVEEALEEAGRKGARVAIVYGAQFAEAGAQGRLRQDRLLQIARAHGMRLVGPNCMGVISLASGFVASFTTAPEHHDGNGWPEVGTISVASQSGAVGIQMFAQLRDRGLGLANWISTGNQADIDVADAIAHFAEDDATRTIAIYMEDASRGLKLVQALELARQARKPVVILKVGTTPLGGLAAAGHTASMYVEDRVVDDLFAQYGVLRARSVNDLIDLVAAADAGVIPADNRVAAISVSGGGAVMISDAAARGGLELPDYPADALAELKAVNSFVNDRNPIDVSAPSMRDMAITGGHLRWGLERDAPTMLGYVSHIPLVPRTRDVLMPRLLSLAPDHPGKLVAIAMNATAGDRRALIRSGVAVFDDPVVATEAVARLVAAGQAQARPPQAPALPGGARMDLAETRAALEALGIAFAPEARVAGREDALAALAQWGEVTLKLSAETLAHRTELGGVVTGLSTEEGVLRALERLALVAEANRPDHPGIHLVAQPQAAGVEMLVGLRQDRHFGPLVLCGTGGTMCEVFDDIAWRKAPILPEEAEAMIAATRGARMLGPWRGRPAVDRGALASALVALAGAAGDLPSLEINPLFVHAAGVTAVDLVVME